MEMMENLVLAVHVMAALAIIGLVLIQQGKGAEMGSGFGGGASGTVFGSLGAGNFLSRATTLVIAVFFVTSFTLAYFAAEKSGTVANLGMPELMIQDQPAAADDVDSGLDVQLPAVQTESSDAELPEL